MEWARIGPTSVVVATAKRAWLHRCPLGDPHDPFARPMTGGGERATTARLLEGAIGAGLRAGRATGGVPPPLSLLRWVWRLVAYYHLTHHTPQLLQRAAARFERAGRRALAAWAEDKAREEAGHDRLALRDLAELGYQAGVVAVVPPVAAAMVARFERDAAAPEPLGVVAYAHTVERLAMTLGATALEAVEAVLPPGCRAWRCLKVHSALGSDAAHVEDNVALIAGLPAPERAAIALACREVAEIFSKPARTGGYETDAQLVELLHPWKTA